MYVPLDGEQRAISRSLRRLEVVDGLDPTDDLRGRLDILHDLIHVLVGHGGLIQGVGDDAGGVDARHLGFVLSHGQPLKGGGARHEATCAVGSGAVPVLVALTHADQGAVTHIDGDEELLPRLGGDRALAEDHLIHVDVVVDGLKGLQSGPAATLKNDLRHLLAVALGKLLADIHVMEVVLHEGAVEVAEVTGEGGILGLELVLQGLQGGLDLGAPPLGLVGGNDLLPLLEILFLAYVEVNGDLLVVFRHLGAEVAAARVDDEVLPSLLVGVHLDEVVAAAQGAQGSLQPLGVFQLAVTAQAGEVEALLPSLPDVPPAGDGMSGRVQLFKVDLDSTEVDGVHTAPDVHPHHGGDDLIGNGHGGADGTALARVDVGHDADLAVREGLGVADLADLLHGTLVHGGGEALGGVMGSYDLYHDTDSFLYA